MDNIAQSLFNLLFNLINVFITSIMGPINTIMGRAFEAITLGQHLVIFYSVLNNYVIPGVLWFVNLIPPYTWDLIVIYFTFQMALFSISVVAHAIIKPLSIVKRLIPFV